MIKTEFSCNREGLTIRGTEYRCEKKERQAGWPIAVICHGFGGNQYDLAFYAEAFAEMGYAVYCFDFCGGCVTGKSDGSSLDMTIETETKDLIAVLDYAKSLPYTVEEHILLTGGSQGGYVAGIVAAERAEEIGRLILFYPALCIPDHAREGRLGGANYNVNQVPEVIDTFGVRISRKFHEGVVDKDAVAQICGYRGPVLLIHGSEDMVVDSRYAEAAAAAYENCHLQILQGAGHGFSKQQREQVIVSVREFLKGHREILCIHVHVTDCEEKQDGDETVCYVHFEGECRNEYFQGRILPGAVDEQHYRQGQQTSICAVYELEGQDCKGNSCKIGIVNQKAEDGCFRPKVQTDSPELAFLNHSELLAALEFYAGGLTVRIFEQ